MILIAVMQKKILYTPNKMILGRILNERVLFLLVYLFVLLGLVTFNITHIKVTCVGIKWYRRLISR